MIKALLLLFSPVRTWNNIVEANRSVGFILFFYLIPLLAVSALGEGSGLRYMGKTIGPAILAASAKPKQFAPHELGVYLALQAILSILVVFLAAKLLMYLGETFHGRHTFTQAFRTVAYGLAPYFLFRAVDGFREVRVDEFWWMVTWAIGITLAWTVLYIGVPCAMKPDPPQAFGLYVTCCLVLALVTFIVRLLTAWWLTGKFPVLQAQVFNWLGVGP